MSRRRYQILTPERLAAERERRLRLRRTLRVAAVAGLGVLALAVALALILSGRSRPRDYRGSVEASNQARQYLVHLPPDYSTHTPLPVVLAFHGYLQTPEELREYIQLDGVADREGFIVVYPLGFLRIWEVDPVDQTQVDDLEFVGALIDQLGRELAIDTRRVYATGYSQGGAFALRLACQMSDRIAAVASVAGTTTSDMWNACEPVRPVPVMMIHGTADRVVPYLWTASDLLLSVPDVVAGWASRNGCDPVPQEAYEPDIANDGTRVRRVVYTGCEGGVETILYAVEGGTHTWPGAAPVEGMVGVTSRDIDANTLIWQFFSRYALP